MSSSFSITTFLVVSVMSSSSPLFAASISHNSKALSSVKDSRMESALDMRQMFQGKQGSLKESQRDQSEYEQEGSFQTDEDGREKVFERNMQRQVEKRQSASQSSLGSVLIVLGYCFIALVSAAVLLAILRLFVWHKKSNKKNKNNFDTSWDSEQSSKSKRKDRKNKEKDRKEAKRKDKKDRREKSFFVSLPDDDEKKDKKRKCKDKDKDRKEKRRNQQSTKRDKQRHRQVDTPTESTFMKEYSEPVSQSTSEAQVSIRSLVRRRNREKYNREHGRRHYRSDSNNYSTPETESNRNRNSMTSKSTFMFTSDKSESPLQATYEEPKPNDIQIVPVDKSTLADEKAVIYVYKSSVSKIGQNGGVHINPLDLIKVLPMAELTKPQPQPKVPTVATIKQDDPTTPSSPFSMVLFQSDALQNHKTNFSSFSPSDSNSEETSENSRSKQVLTEIVNKVRSRREESTESPPYVQGSQKSSGKSDSEANASEVIFKLVKSDNQRHQTAEAIFEQNDAPLVDNSGAKSILRGGSKTTSLVRTFESLSGKSKSMYDDRQAEPERTQRRRRPQSLKRVSFSRKLEVRYIK